MCEVFFIRFFAMKLYISPTSIWF